MSNVTTPTIDTNSTPVAKSSRIPEISGELCDSCGGGATAKHVAYKEDFSLFFCTHHTRSLQAKLVSQGFKIYPDNASE